MQTPAVQSVAALSAYIKTLLETDRVLSNVRVSGEVSNITYHASGHVYFTLKDAESQISCAMFRTQAQRAARMQNGERVILSGQISLYLPRGTYQLIVNSVEKEGTGDLFRQFVALREKLEREGLFDPARKRRLPLLPSHLALVTSPTGAAVRDVLRTLRRRYPHLRVTVVPAIVQGADGVPSVLRALDMAGQIGAEAILLVRGGGSIEDLWCFNHELVARAIAASPIPVVTGIGHETDFTIADFVADFRASTPTAAAEHAVPEAAAIRATIQDWQAQLVRSLRYYIDFKRQVVDDYTRRLQTALKQFLERKRHEVQMLSTRLDGLNPTSILEQGYSVVLHEGKVVASVADLAEGQPVEIAFADGRAQAEITNIIP